MLEGSSPSVPANLPRRPWCCGYIDHRPFVGVVTYNGRRLKTVAPEPDPPALEWDELRARSYYALWNAYIELLRRQSLNWPPPAPLDATSL